MIPCLNIHKLGGRVLSRKILLVVLLTLLLLLATGCTNIDEPIDPQGGIWDRYFVYPLAWSLDYFAQLLNPSGDVAKHQYGWAIVIVTIILRLLTLPLMIKQIKSSRVMASLQPEIQKIREKYQKDQQKLQEETMKLFQKHNVNPLAGCLPILVQMPILIAFYHAIYRHELIPDHVFLGILLGEPFWLLALLAGLTTYLQQKVMGVQQNNPQMQVMLVVMPIMITVFAFYFPAALSLYWVIGNIFTIIQTYFMRDQYQLGQEGTAK